MKRFFSILILLIVSGFCGILVGCGDKYANLSISVSTNLEREEDGSITLYIGDDVADSAELTITMENAPGDFNYVPLFSMSNEIIKVNTNNEMIENGVKKIITASSPGSTVLTIYTSEGGKSTTLNVNVVKVATGIEFKPGLKFGLVREYGATLNIDYNKYIDIYPTDSNQRTVRYSIVSYTTGGVEIEGAPNMSELYVNARTGIVTIINSATEITSVKVQARIDNSRAYYQDGTVLPDIYCTNPVEVKLFNKITQDDISLYVANDIDKITLPEDATPEEIEALEKITVTDATVKTLIKNIDKINAVDVILKVKTSEDISVEYPTDLLNIPVFVAENNIFSSGTSNYYQDAEGYKYYAYTITATRSTTDGKYADDIYKLNFSIGYQDYIVEGYPINKLQNIICETFIKTFSINDSTILSGEDYDLKVYKTDATNNTKIKVSVANPLNITEENSKFIMSVYKDNGFELVDVTKTFNQYFRLSDNNGTVNYLQDEDDNYKVFDNNTTFTIKANSVFVTIGEVYVFKISAYRPNSEIDKFDGITAEEVDAMKATANVVATITQGIEYISEYHYSLTEYDNAGNPVVVNYEGKLNQDKLVGDKEINIDNMHTDELEVAILAGPDGADIEGLTAVSKNTKIVDIALKNGILTLKPITIGSTEILLGANTLNKVYTIRVNVYNPIENFRVNLQSTDREAGVGYYEEVDSSLSNVTSVLGSPIYFVVTTNPTTAKYKELNYYVKDISAIPHKELTMGERGVFSDENFIFDSENLFFQYNSENAVGKVYQIEIEMINFDNSVITKSFETSTYIPNNYTTTISKATIYNPLKINYENKVPNLLFTDTCNSSFSIIVNERNERATYKFKDYGEFVVKVNGFTNTSIFNQYYDEFNNIYWFTVDEEAVKNITSYPQVIYISAQLNELGAVKTSTTSIVLTDPKTVTTLTALDIEKSEIYFKKGVTEDKSVSIMVSPSSALNKDLYVKQFYLDRSTMTYVDVTDAEESQRVCTVSLVGTMSSTQYIYKYNISTMSDNLKAGNAVLIFMPKDKINLLEQFTTLNAGDVYDVIDLWEDCMAITIQSSDGTKENPYHVSTVVELKEIGQNETTLSKYYVLTSNIMVADNWTPIGSDQTVGLSGGLNGIYSFYFIKNQTLKTYRYSITNINYTGKDSKIPSFGLFNKVDEGGLLENLDLTYSYVSANFIYGEVDNPFKFGGVAAVNNGTIENCKVTFNNVNITVGNATCFGGVAGENGGTIKNSDTKFSGVFGKVNLDVYTITSGASIYIGGIAGINKGTIAGSLELPDVTPQNYTFGSAGFDCSATINITKNPSTEELGITAVGGAVGYHTEAIIENLSIQTIINAEEFNYVGGIVGSAYNDGSATKTTKIHNSYFCGKVVGNKYVGGVAGRTEGIDSKEIIISYSSAENYKDASNKERTFITGNSFVGGLIGEAVRSKISYCYAVSYFEEDDTYDIVVKEKIAGSLIGASKHSYVEYSATILNIQVPETNTEVYAFIGGGTETSATEARSFFVQGKCSDASIKSVAKGGVTIKDYYSTFNGLGYTEPTGISVSEVWDTSREYAYLKNGYGKPLFAVAPLTVSAVVIENNDGVLHKVNEGKQDEKELAYIEGYISNDVRSAVVFLHTINEGSYSQKEIVKIEERLKENNTINIENIVDLNVLPLTNKSARLTIKSSNPDVVFVNTNGTLLLKKEGDVTITIGSKLNSENYNTTVYLIVRKGITEFIISESANLTTENDLSLKEEDVEILKSGTKSLFVGSKFEVELEDFDSLKYKEIENISDGLDGRTAFGTRYIVTVDAFEESIIGSTDVIPNLASLFTINGFSWNYNATGLYYYVDIPYGTTTSINPINATGDNPCVIQIIPYLSINYVNADGTIDLTKNKIYFEDCKKEFSIKIIKGAEAITFTNNGVELPQLYTLKLVVNMDTNYEEDQILLTNFNEYTQEGYEHRLQIINGLQNRIYDEKGNVIRVTAEFTINYLNKEKMLTENQVYSLNFRALSNPKVKNTYTFTYTPQGILDVGYTLYSKLSDYKNNNGSDTNIIYNGQTALLAVEVYPYFSNFDSMEVLYLTEVNNTMSIQQYKYDVNNSSFSDYIEGGAIYDKNVGLFVNKATGTDTYKDNENGIYSYSKVYFFGLLVGSDVPDYTDITIRVKFYKQGEQVAPYNSEFKFTAVSQPTITLSFKDETLLDNEGVYNLPLGTENVLDVRLRNFAGEIEWTITSPSGYELNKAQTLAFTPKLVNGKYIVTVGDLENNALYLDLIGHTFNIKATIYKDDFVSTHDVNFKVTLFTIQSILVEGVSNDYLSVPVYSTTPLSVELVYYASPAIESLYDSWRAFYNADYLSIYGYGLALTFSDFINELTVAINREAIWYAVSNVTGEYEELVKGQSYSDDLFEVTDYMNDYALYGYRTDITTQMKIVVPISYNDGVPGRVLTEGEPPVIKEGFEERKEFVHAYNMIFVYKTGLINAIPISTQEDFETMEEGKDYRLINDIELKNYNPISTKIASLDGNNYTIYVTGFGYASDYKESAHIGLFETVDTDTTLYNVKVCYTERVTRAVVDDEVVLNPSTNPLIVSLKQANLVYFGGIATTNDGSITNATVEGRITVDVNVNEESGVAVAQTLNGGIVSTNNGYITNSKVENFEFAGYGNTAGVVGVNNNIVTSTYTNELKLVNKSTNYTGGFVYQNAKDGLIESCYVQGKRAVSDLEMRNQGDGIQASGQVGGFVYENIGKIQNCYANISLASSSFLAGFAFIGGESSLINNCYTICKNNGENKATTSPFSGGTTGNAVSYKGTIQNSYYFNEGWDKKDGEQAKALTSDEFATSASFVTFDMANETTLGKYVDGSGEYQYANGYTWMMAGGKPELVATAVKTTSFMKYAGKSKVYSDVSVVYPYDGATSNITLGDQLIEVELQDNTKLFLTYDYNRIINSKQIIFEKRIVENLSAYTNKGYSISKDADENHYVWVEEGTPAPANAEEIYEYFIYQYGEEGPRKNIFYDSNGKYANGTSVEEYGTLKNIHYLVIGAQYQGKELEVTLDLENNYRANDTITCYYTADGKQITSIVYQTCESAQYYYTDFVDKKSEMYGSITNPYLIYDYNSFAVYLSSNAKAGVYFRFVRDIDLDYRTPPTMYTVFNGNIQGNFMTIENINITYLSQEETASDGFGLFAEIVATTEISSVSNLTLEVGEVSSSSHNYVGALAGKVSTNDGAKIKVLFSNINVVSTEDENGYVLGKNYVGGLIGYGTGNTQLKAIHTSLWVNATRDFYQANNQYYLYQILKESDLDETYTVLGEVKTVRELIKEALAIVGATISDTKLVEKYNEYVRDKVSYAGGVVGVLDANSLYNYSMEEFNASDLTVDGEAVTVGVTVGGAIGYIGENTKVKDVKVLLESENQYIGAVAYAGGIVGENRGKIISSKIEFTNEATYEYGELDTEEEYFKALNNTSIIAIGGIAGLNIGNKDGAGEVIGGIIENSITSVNVRSNYALIAGGAVGRMIGGSLNSVISTGSVRAKNIIGGLVGTVNDRISVVHTSTNNYGFIHSNPQLLILPKTEDKADQAYFKQCIAATNWVMEEYGYLDSITRLVGGFIGIEVFSTYESTSGAYYSDFGTYENQRSFFANTLFKTSTDVVEKYIPVMFGGRECDVYGIDQAENYYKSIQVGDLQMVYPYAGNKMYKEIPETYTCNVSSENIVNTGTAERDEILTFAVSDGWTIECADTISEAIHVIAEGHMIKVSKGSEVHEFVVGGLYEGSTNETIAQIVCYAEGDPALEITKVVVSVRATLNTSTWTVVKTYAVETNKINVKGHTILEGANVVTNSNPVYINDVYLTVGRVLPDKSVIKDITINAVKNESSENVITDIKVTYQYNVEASEFAKESRKVEETGYTYTLSIDSKAVVYRYLLEDYWDIPEEFYGDINDASNYFPNINLYLTIKKWEDFTATGFAGGNGTVDTPYLIETPEQLALMMKYVNDGTHTFKHYKVKKDIDLSGKYWTPIGTEDHPFNGKFDASYTETNGIEEVIKFNTIYYTMVNSRGNNNNEYKYAGLFGYVENGGISNVKTIGGNIQGKVAGGIVGYYNSASVISNIENGNTVTGTNYVGGIAGNADGDSKITKATNYGKLTLNTKTDSSVSPENDFYIGGVAGSVANIALEEDCFNYGNINVIDEVTNYAASIPVKANTYVGGVSGVVISTASNKTYNYGKIYVVSSADKLYVGGVVGYFGVVGESVKTYYRGINKAPITVDYKTIDSINDFYAVESLIYKGKPIDGTAFANVGGVVGVAAGVGLSVNEEKIDFICEYNTNSIISIGGVIGTVYATNNSIVEQNSNVATIESQTPNTSTINIVGGIVGSVMYETGGSAINILNNYNTGNIITSATSYQISGGLLGTTIAKTAMKNTDPAYYCYQVGNFSLVGSDVTEHVGEFVYLYYNYNLGTISISSLEEAYNSVGAIVGLLNENHIKLHKESEDEKVYNYSLTGSSEYLSMKYESGVFHSVDISKNCISMLSTTLHNELFERLSDGELNKDMWENRYLSWYPTLKNNETQVLWENYTENFSITAGSYTINSAEQLAYLAKAVNSGLISTEGKTYKLTSTINLENKYFTPIGTEEYPFMGTFDGNGFVIKNMTIDGNIMINGSSYLNETTIDMGGNLTKTYAGLFGFIKNATITNVGIEAPIITNVGFAGGVAYSAENSSISYCYTDTNEFKDNEGFMIDVGEIKVGYYVGGIVCFAKNCYPTEANNYKAKINNCYNNVTIINTNAGHTLSGIAIIEHCYVENCYNTAIIRCDAVGEKTFTIGPIVATKTSEDNTNYVKYCYSIGEVTSKNPAIVYTTESGLLIDDVTYGEPTIANLTNWQWDMTNVWTNEYTLNEFDPSDDVGQYHPSLRGLGQNWKSTESENLVPYSSKEDALLALQAMYEKDKLSERTTHGIHFINEIVVGEDNYTYYLIENAEQLALLSRQVNDGVISTAKAEFILVNDIDLSGKYWTPIGKNSNYAFRGIFNFNGYTINGLTIDSSTLAYAGLFGYVKGGKICNGYINNAFIRITSEDSTVDLYAGTLAANVYDTMIENIEVTTTIGAFSNKHAVAGGLVATFSILSPHEAGQPDYTMSNVKVNPQGPISCGDYETQVLESVGSYADGKDEGQMQKDRVIIGAFSKGGDTFVGGIVGKMKGMYTARDQEAILKFATNTAGVVSITLSSSSTAYAGGIAGMISENSRISVATNSPYAYIKTHSGMYDRTGGIVGYLYDSIVEDCFNDSAYMESTKAGHTTSYLGGIVGFAETPKIVKNCISTAYTRRNYNLGLTIWGGIIGYFDGYTDDFFVENSEWKPSFFMKELGFNKCIGNVVKGSDDENLILEVDSKLIMKGLIAEALDKGKDDAEGGLSLTDVHGFDTKYWILGSDGTSTYPKLMSDIVKVILGEQLRVEALHERHIVGDTITIVKEGGTDTKIRLDMYYGGYQVSTIYDLTTDGSRSYYNLGLLETFNFTGIDGEYYASSGFGETALIYVTLVS